MKGFPDKTTRQFPNETEIFYMLDFMVGESWRQFWRGKSTGARGQARFVAAKLPWDCTCSIRRGSSTGFETGKCPA